MRVLTIFTVILLPLTLIAGIYGMNGIDLNKLDTSPTGFVLVMIMMACVAIGLLVFFVKKKWLWVREKTEGESVHQQNVREQKNPLDNQNSHISYHVFKKG